MTKRDITLHPPAVHFLRGSGGRGDGAVVENWERAVRASGAIKALVLWDAWNALKTSTAYSFVGFLFALAQSFLNESASLNVKTFSSDELV